ncbi:hypothetical protein [uncultured Victivallis sp.]|uniref:hypothetical protein n=1 Tax=uncultured Victivallis sp. TaxID=354118 RepID=UPI0025F91F83|nr:hypothetical protein [uncultured Victivallis sp.]
MEKFFKTLLAFLFATASVSFAILVFSGGALFWHRQFGGNANLLENEMAFYASQGYEAGVYLKEVVPDQQILLLVDPDFYRNENIKQLAYTLIEGYGSNNVVPDTIHLSDARSEMPMPLYMSMTADDFDSVVEQHPDASVVISTIGLPVDLDSLRMLQNEGAPKLLLLGLPSGPIPGLTELIRKGKVLAVVLSNPEARYDVPAPKDRREAFRIRYLLVTKENLDQHLNLFAN